MTTVTMTWQDEIRESWQQWVRTHPGECATVVQVKGNYHKNHMCRLRAVMWIDHVTLGRLPVCRPHFKHLVRLRLVRSGRLGA